MAANHLVIKYEYEFHHENSSLSNARFPLLLPFLSLCVSNIIGMQREREIEKKRKEFKCFVLIVLRQTFSRGMVGEKKLMREKGRERKKWMFEKE